MSTSKTLRSLARSARKVAPEALALVNDAERGLRDLGRLAADGVELVEGVRGALQALERVGRRADQGEAIRVQPARPAAPSRPVKVTVREPLPGEALLAYLAATRK